MSHPLPPSKGDEEKDATPCDQGEAEELESFCRAVTLDEISFERWQLAHTDLDVNVPLFLTEEEALHGVVKEVKWSRAVATGPQGPSPQSQRVREARVVNIEPRMAHGTRLMIPDQGDQAQGRTGHLIITVFIKPSSAKPA